VHFLANEKKAIEAMFDREQKQEKNLEIRERDLKRSKALETEARNREVFILFMNIFIGTRQERCKG
jgi:hypothetical protein